MASRNKLPQVSRLQNQIDRLFEDFFLEPFPSFQGSQDSGKLEFLPPCDVEETDKQYLLSFDLPGVKKDDVKVDLQNGVLTVSGERKEEHEEKQKGRRSRERSYGYFSRSFTLPSDIDLERIDAGYEDGVLRISIDKRATPAGKQIEIKSGKTIAKKPEKAA